MFSCYDVYYCVLSLFNRHSKIEAPRHLSLSSARIVRLTTAAAKEWITSSIDKIGIFSTNLFFAETTHLNLVKETGFSNQKW